MCSVSSLHRSQKVISPLRDTRDTGDARRASAGTPARKITLRGEHAKKTGEPIDGSAIAASCSSFSRLDATLVEEDSGEMGKNTYIALLCDREQRSRLLADLSSLRLRYLRQL